MKTRTKKAKGDTRQPDLPAMPPKNKSTLRAEELAAALEEQSHCTHKRNVKEARERLVQQLIADMQTATACQSAGGIRYQFTMDTKREIKVKQLG